MDQQIVEESKYVFIKNLFLLVIRFGLNYLKALFLTGSVIFSSGILIFIILNINPDFSFGFMKYLSFLNPAYASGTFSLGIKDVMKIFSVVSLGVMAAISLLKIILKKYYDYELIFRHKFRTLFLLITSLYVLVSLIVAFSDKLESGFYAVFAVFYVINIISVMLYLLIDTIYRKVMQAFVRI